MQAVARKSLEQQCLMSDVCPDSCRIPTALVTLRLQRSPITSGNPNNIANPDKAPVKYLGSYSAVASHGVITARPE